VRDSWKYSGRDQETISLTAVARDVESRIFVAALDLPNLRGHTKAGFFARHFRAPERRAGLWTRSHLNVPDVTAPAEMIRETNQQAFTQCTPSRKSSGGLEIVYIVRLFQSR